MHADEDILPRGGPWRPPAPRAYPLAIELGRNELVRRIPSGPDDECYWARLREAPDHSKLFFLRRFPPARFRTSRAGIVGRYKLDSDGVAQLFEFGRSGEWGYIACDLVDGASLVELAAHRIPWLVALAIAHDACRRLARFHEAKLDAAVTPARVILAPYTRVTFCPGVPAAAPPPWHHAVCALVHPILALAATPDERALLRDLFSDPAPDAIWVASDALVQRHPELDPALPMLFLSLAGRVDGAQARQALVERLAPADFTALWHRVNEVVRAKSRSATIPA